MHYPTKLQRGFVMMAGIFLLVVLAALGAYMVSFANTQKLNIAQDIQGSRAYWAARSGLEWAVSTILSSPPLCPSVSSLTVDDFNVSVSFTCQTYNESGFEKTLYWFNSIARSAGNVGGLGQVERSLSASIEITG